MAKMVLGKYFPPFMVTKLRNKITNFRQRLDKSLFEAWERSTVGQTQNVYAVRASQGGNSYQVERETEETKDTVPPTNDGSTKDVQPSVVQIETPIPTSEPIVAPVAEFAASPDSAPKPNQKPSIPYPSRFQDQKLCNKTNDQKEKFFKIFQHLNFNISFADALILMPKFGPSIKSLLTSKDKLFELARTSLNDHCSAVLLKNNPTPYYDPIVSTSSSTLTPFRDNDFLLEEVDAFLPLEDDAILTEVDQSYYDPEGNILLLEAFLNDDPSLPPPTRGNYLP
nr:reverse transcriptase domain-containing protein [Tanacetum cinerariifolium]